MTEPASIEHLTFHDVRKRVTTDIEVALRQYEPEDYWPEELQVYTRLRNAVISQMENLALTLMEQEAEGDDTNHIGQCALANAHSIVAACTEFSKYATEHWRELSAGGTGS